MQTTKNILLFSIAGILLTGMLGTSCKKDSALSFGIPTITRIAQPLDSTSITSGSFTQWVIIYGTHLASTQSVSFNDQEVPYKTMYASDTSVTVQIPRAIPQNVTNTVTVTTKGGKATFQFTTVIPNLQLTGILNEYTSIGDTLTLAGANFDLYGLDTTATTVSFAGGATVNVVDGTATTLRVVVPASAQPGPLTLKGIAPLNISMTTIAWYHDNRNFLFDMSHFNGWNGNAFLSSGPDPAPVNGPYFKVAKSWQGGWAWDPFCSNNCAMPAELVNDPSKYVNYALKFEMYTPVNPPALPLKLYMVFNSGNFKEFFYDAGNGSYPYSTGGKWRTFTVPLKSWGNLQGFTFSNPIIMEFMLKDSNPSQSNFSICNFRMVPIN
ncbi:MAG: IPT/TIG domain-containing protein [Chitinophagaceae bacterium]|nr:IPT/TIG domain-containing protein [Chitinophagaceae bacterium]